MIRRLKVQGYKSLKNIEIFFEPVSIIFGPNAAGKSNVLDALNLVSGLVASKNIKQAFDQHRGLPLESFYYGDQGYEKLLEAETAEARFEIDVELSPGTVNSVEKLIAEKRQGMDTKEKSKKRITERFLRYTITIQILPTSLGHLRMEGRAHPTYYDLGLDHTVVSMPLYEPHHPHIAAFREEIPAWRFHYFEPRTLMREYVPAAKFEERRLLETLPR
jgi:predicted ATPase